jgi:hypothetical protein
MAEQGLAWEVVTDWTHRLPVPGGWLYRYVAHKYVSCDDGRGGAYPVAVSVSLCFVPWEATK